MFQGVPMRGSMNLMLSLSCLLLRLMLILDTEFWGLDI